MNTETKPTDFGTSEESRTVPAEKLEIGVRVSGIRNETAALVVQAVDVVYTDGRSNKKTIRVEFANFNTGDDFNMFFRPDKPMTVWGKL